MRLLLLAILWMISPAFAGENKMRVDCLQTLAMGKEIKGLRSDKSFTFPQNDLGQRQIVLKDKTDSGDASSIVLDGRFYDEIRDHAIKFNLQGPLTEGAIIPNSRVFSISPEYAFPGLRLVIRDQPDSNLTKKEQKKKSKPIAAIVCASNFDLEAPLKDKRGTVINLLKCDQHRYTYAYMNECLKLAGFTPVECPLSIEEEEVALPKKASRKLKPNLAPGMAGDEVSASVPSRSGSAQ